MKQRFSLLISTLVAITVLLPSETIPLSAADRPSATVTLLSEATVTGDTITLQDIAKVSSKDKTFAQLLKNIPMGQPPWPGQTISIDTGQIRLRLKTAQVDPALVTIPEPSRVKVARACQTVSGDQLADIVKSAVVAAWQSEDRIECEVLQKPQDVVVRAGRLKLSPLVCAPRGGLFTVPVEIRVDNDQARRVSVSVRVKVFRPVVVTSQAVARDQMLTDADLKIEERELGGTTTDTMADVSAAVNLRTTRAIAAGGIVRKSDLDVIPIVRKNAPVNIVAVAGRVSVRSGGIALEDGQMGQLVKVKTDGTNQPITGKVIGDARIEIQL